MYELDFVGVTNDTSGDMYFLSMCNMFQVTKTHFSVITHNFFSAKPKFGVQKVHTSKTTFKPLSLGYITTKMW